MTTTVMVGEKPKVASKIAQALGDYSIEENRGVKNYIIEKENETVIIAPAVGHIFNLEQSEGDWTYPIFNVEWQPTFKDNDDAAYVKKYYNNLKDQIEKADQYINACDYDLEGCLQHGEKVLIREDGKIKITTAGNLIDNLIENRPSKTDGEFEYVECDDLEIVGMNNWSNNFSDVEKVMRRPSDDNFLEITVFNGRKAKVSKNHPMLVATNNGLESKKAGNLEKGDQILSSTEIPDNNQIQNIDLIEKLDNIYIHSFKKDMEIMPAEMCKYVEKSRKQCLNYRYNDRMPKDIFVKLEDKLGFERSDLTISSYKGSTKLPAKLELDKQLGRFIGLYLAEGCIDSSGFIGLYFGPEENLLVEEVQEFLEVIGTEGKTRKRHIEGSYGDSECFEVGTKSKILRKLLEEFELGKESGDKRLPSWVLSAPEEFKEGLISGYWDGDGSVFIDSKDDRAIASAGSKSSDLLEDIFYLLQTYGVNASFQDWDYTDRQMTNLTIGRSQDLHKASQLFSYSKEIREKIEETAIKSNSRMENLPTCLATRQKVKPEKKGQLNAAETIANKQILDWEEEMEGYPEGDVTFLTVKDIQEKETSKDYFYDFQTETRNFMHGNGIISHNSVIGSNVIKLIANPDEDRIRRMKFSTLTPNDLQDAYDNLESFDKGMTDAGVTRHILDFYYGVNVSRALMQAVQENDRYKTLSTGRVQGPALKVLADKEREIQEFDPTDYWEIYLQHSEFEAQFITEGEKNRIWDEEVADGVMEELSNADRTEVDDISINNYKHKAPVPFNLTGLQSEASSQFRINPKRTQQLAQNLYEQGLISYPRTESQKLPARLGHKNILKKFKKQDKYEDLAKKVLKKDKSTPKQGKKTDDAHPAIYPTGKHPSGLSKQERKIYDLIVKRYFAVFGDAAQRRTLTMTLKTKDYLFEAKSKVTVERNWFDLYDPYVKVEEAELPELDEGDQLDVEGFKLEDKETKPPRRYTQSRIVNELEKKNLGTKATRAQVIDRLYNRKYIKEDSIEVTDLGMAVVEALEKNCPELLSEELTREFEEKMESIKNGEETSDEVVDEAEETLTKMLEEFKKKEKEIGAELIESIDEQRKKERRLGPCEVCKEEGREDGKLRILKTDNGKFVGCTNYPDCENTYPLPNNGKINSTKEECKKCGKPTIYVKRKSSKSYQMCVDPDCPSKDDW